MTDELEKKTDIVKIECHRYTLDWYESVIVEIDLNEWVFFTVDYRGKNDWFLIGNKPVNDKWIQEELSIHGIYWNSLVSFIKSANKKRCMVSRFNNFHYYNGFYDELSKLLTAVKKESL